MNKKTPIAPKYIKDFEQLGFGLFVHYGLYSQLNSGEWTFHNHHRNMDEYMKQEVIKRVQAGSFHTYYRSFENYFMKYSISSKVLFCYTNLAKIFFEMVDF